MSLSRESERSSDALTTTRAALRRSRASVSDFFLGRLRFLDEFQERSRPAGLFLGEKMSLSRASERLGDALTTARALLLFRRHGIYCVCRTSKPLNFKNTIGEYFWRNQPKMRMPMTGRILAPKKRMRKIAPCIVVKDQRATQSPTPSVTLSSNSNRTTLTGSDIGSWANSLKLLLLLLLLTTTTATTTTTRLLLLLLLLVLTTNC